MINKRILTLICALAMLLLAGCGGGEKPEVPLSETDVVSGVDVSETTTTTTTTTTTAPPIGNANEKAPINDDGTGIFYMNMSVESFKVKVEELGWTWTDTNSNEYLPGYDLVARISPEDKSMVFTFGDNNQLVCMNVATENIETEKGIKIGDSGKKIKKLYGDPTRYEPWEEGFESYYYYSTGDVVITFSVDHSTKKITQWKLGFAEYADW